MNRAYGAEAQAWAARLPAGVPIVSTDLSCVAPAFAEAARRRKVGECFSAALLMDDARARCALFVAAPLVLAQVTDFDERSALLDAIAARGLNIDGKPQLAFEGFDGRYVRTALEFLVTADVVAVRSGVERERLCEVVGRRFPHVTSIAPPDTTVPPPPALPGGGGKSIVVWAPQLPAEACGIFAFALEEFRRPVIVVCGPGQAPAMRAGTRFVAAADGAAALAEATIIVDASLSDPGTARALSRWRVPIATASTAGTQDWLDGVTVFQPWNHRTIASAIADALGFRAPRELAHPLETTVLEEALAYSAPPAPRRGPLVSVVVPTINRRSSLRATLASIDAQTYPNLEIIVVNDGGPPLDSTLPGARRTRCVTFPENRGVNAALNAGIAAARGSYIALLADDDVFCPDHLARLLEPLERISGDIAHSIELVEHFDGGAEDEHPAIGHSLIAGDPAMPTILQTCNVIGGPSIMFRRSVFGAVGPFDERAGHLSDLEMWLRMSSRFEFAHVDHVTAVMSMRNDRSQASAVSGVQTAAFYRTIYDLHPSARPAVRARREQHLAEVAAINEVHTLPQLPLSS